LLNEQLLAVHVVGVDDDGIAQLKQCGAAIVWCPTSNCFLFQATAPHPLFDGSVDVLLGSDSLLTGAGTLLDELRAARSLGFLSDQALVAAVGSTAARRLQLSTPSLEHGARADVIVLRKPVLDARPADVSLVVAGGRIVLANEPLAESIGGAIMRIDIGGVPKVLPSHTVRSARRAIALAPECERILS
jgi:cytosine/adenosine deaminase-related metal-dependent hydrolase